MDQYVKLFFSFYLFIYRLIVEKTDKGGKHPKGGKNDTNF